MATFLKQGFCYQEKKIQIIFAKWRKFDTKKSLTSAALQNWKKKKHRHFWKHLTEDALLILSPNLVDTKHLAEDALLMLSSTLSTGSAVLLLLSSTLSSPSILRSSRTTRKRERERVEERGGVWGRAENYAMQKRKVGIQAETFTHQKAPVFERARHGFYDLAVCDRQAHVPLSRTSRGLRVGILLKAKASKRPVPPSSPPGSSQAHK